MVKILLWGMGKVTYEFLENISLLKCDVEYVGITASNITESILDNFLGIPVLSIDEWCSTSADYMVVCSRTHECEIKKNIKNRISINCNIPIVNPEEVYSEIYLYNDEIRVVHDELLKNNALYRFFYNEKHTFMTKWFHYFDVYDKWFAPYRGKEIVFCEVGVFKGGSVQMWKEYFGENATIIGIDINEECKKYEEDKIHIEIGDQGNAIFWNYIKCKYPHIDILLDDGGHFVDQQILTFAEMFSHIADGGIYMCEDTNSSYIESYGGGYKKATTFIEYAKSFVDDINAYHIDTKQLCVNYNTRNMTGLHIYDNIVLIEKRRQLFPFVLVRDTLERL